jgi:hypothetical protein
MHEKRMWELAAALCIAALGCGQKAQGQCYCPAGGSLSATIALACPASNATVTATGQCSATQTSPQLVAVTAGDAGGTCQVTVTGADGATSSTAFQVDSTWLACGSDPHGCGQAISLSPGYVEAGVACETGDAGTTD